MGAFLPLVRNPIWLSVGLCLGIGSGCAAVTSTKAVGAARVELKAAETAGAEERAPYEYKMAKAYLDKAGEEEGEAEYEAATTLAQKAKGWAEVARRKAEAEGAKAPTRVSTSSVGSSR